MVAASARRTPLADCPGLLAGQRVCRWRRAGRRIISPRPRPPAPLPAPSAGPARPGAAARCQLSAGQRRLLGLRCAGAVGGQLAGSAGRKARRPGHGGRPVRRHGATAARRPARRQFDGHHDPPAAAARRRGRYLCLRPTTEASKIVLRSKECYTRRDLSLCNKCFTEHAANRRKLAIPRIDPPALLPLISVVTPTIPTALCGYCQA